MADKAGLCNRNSQEVFATRVFRGGGHGARPRFHCLPLQLHFLRARCPPFVAGGPGTACGPCVPGAASVPSVRCSWCSWCPMPRDHVTSFLRACAWCPVPRVSSVATRLLAPFSVTTENKKSDNLAPVAKEATGNTQNHQNAMKMLSNARKRKETKGNVKQSSQTQRNARHALRMLVSACAIIFHVKHEN